MGCCGISSASGGSQCSWAYTIGLSAALSFALLRIGHLDDAMKDKIAQFHTGDDYDREIAHFGFQQAMGIVALAGIAVMGVSHIVAFFFIKILQWAMFIETGIWTALMIVEYIFSYIYMRHYRAFLLSTSEVPPIINPEWSSLITTAGAYGWVAGAIAGTSAMLHICVSAISDKFYGAGPNMYVTGLGSFFFATTLLTIGIFDRLTPAMIVCLVVSVSLMIVLWLTRCIPAVCKKVFNAAAYSILAILSFAASVRCGWLAAEHRAIFIFSSYRPSFEWTGETSLDATSDSRIIEQRYGAGFIYAGALTLACSITFLACAAHSLVTILRGGSFSPPSTVSDSSSTSS